MTEFVREIWVTTPDDDEIVIEVLSDAGDWSRWPCEFSVRIGSGEMYHATSSLNRASIGEHGLDWRRTGLATGIAGSGVPERQGIFLSETLADAEWFASMGRTPSDIWIVPVDGYWIHTFESRWWIVPEPIPPDWLRLVRTDIPAGTAHP